MNKKGIRFHSIFWLSTILLLVLDQWTKYLAVTHLKDMEPFPIIKNIFCLQYLENHGAAFGILQGQKTYFIIITLIFFVAVFWCYCKIPAQKRYYSIYIVMSLFLAGAAGNFIDRVMQNYVVDFFYFELIHFPIFNVADIYVTCGTIFFLIIFLFYYKEEDLEELSSYVFPFKRKDKERK